MARELGDYRAKRDFGLTSEPEGGEPPPAAERLRFVVQEHHARRLHWDLRLERDGVLVSWAVPKGIPEDPKQNHLAVHTEDHPLEYIDFAGEIPAGQYGAGTMKVFDSGTYDTHKFREGEVMVTFHGERVQGKYVLFQTRGKDWMIHRMDPPADPDREPMPERLVPMLAKAAKELPAGDAAWGHEVKWDGVRALAYVSGGRVRLASRNVTDITPRYPEIRGLGGVFGVRDAVLDGEVVAFDESGRPSFGRLQGRMHLASDSAVRRRMKDTPVVYVIFDLLYLEGRSLMALPYEERRRRLEELGLSDVSWQTPAYHPGDGAALLEATRDQGLEGVIAKRLDSAYEPGRRGGAWLKVKNQRRQSLVVGGYTVGQGGRSSTLGALLVGHWQDGGLTYAGNVGTGFSEAELTRLMDVLEPLRRDTSPFVAKPPPPKGARFVEPRLVAEVAFAEWTKAGILRHPSYLGMRDDEDAAGVTREPEPE